MRPTPVIAFVIAVAATATAADASARASSATVPTRDGAASLHRLDAGRAELQWAGGQRTPVALTDTVLIKLNAPVTDETWSALGVEPVRLAHARLGWWVVRGKPGEDCIDVASRLTTESPQSVEPHRLAKHRLEKRHLEKHRVVPNFAVTRRRHAAAEAPNDPQFGGQWYLDEDRLDILAAWGRTMGDETVSIGVVDNGCDYDHPDLMNKLDGGIDVVDEDDDASHAASSLGNNHGTACAGLIAAETNNEIGIAGVCPHCRLHCIRLLNDDDQPTPIAADVAAFAYALDADLDVVSNSWGFSASFPVPIALREAIELVMTEGRGGLGTVVVFAAGNDDHEIQNFELQAIDGVINVGATNNFGELTTFSNFGDSVDIVAPTGTVTTDISGPDGDDPGDYTGLFGGTSSACPLVAGVTGLLLSAAPEATSAEVLQALRATAEQSFFAQPNEQGHDAKYGYGTIRPLAAIEALAGQAEEPDPQEEDAVVTDTEQPDTTENPAPQEQPTPTSESDSGCQSHATPDPPAPLLLLLLLLLLPRAPRRRT